ncbi:carboxypeptidase-like regulatory domain-containing protein [Dysgonomonas macrotermitis]|uniref:CarboxypepD_reg-like domain-containing protein n=1 Tax=Dysgonomonas macrotermitis TaxID=1346286 RepID=A0A1M5EN19_9BACT|nr:carboxypeptidase-like regulatory domain-containing protein [Dysgonomonas macrotermitis]SHF80576.1 CarboxypepD_reg-like domain-containing protein [Dysgonomonas macrotermitis]
MKYFILSVILLTCLTVCAQSGTVTISGIVTDKETNEPLISVPILLEGTTTGTLTNIDGRYTLKVPENGTLIFRYAEYKSMEVSIAETSCIDIALEAVPKMILQSLFASPKE